MSLTRYWVHENNLNEEPPYPFVARWNAVYTAEDVRAMLDAHTMMIEQLQVAYCYTICDGTHTELCKAAQHLLTRVQEIAP